jgi:Chromosome segregation ATPases
MIFRFSTVWKANRVPLSQLPRYSRGRNPTQPLHIDTAASRHGSASYLRSVLEDDDDDEEEGPSYFDEEYEHQYQFMNGTPLHSRLDSEPFIPVLKSPPPTKRSSRRATSMAVHAPMNRPPPLHIDVDPRSISMSMGAGDPRHPKTPGSKISSFFGWKAANNNTTTSPGGESSSTEISDSGRSAMPSPMPPLANVPFKPGSPYESKSNGYGLPARTPSLGASSLKENIFMSKMADIENELREISSELAGSIRREMDLEDLVERLQLEGPDVNRRTSDYFSDSGTSSVRYASDVGKSEDVEKIRRAAEQERAQLKVELSQKLQDERSQRLASESHVQILESQVQQVRLADYARHTTTANIYLASTRENGFVRFVVEK